MKNKKSVFIIIFFLYFFLIVGFAYLNSTLDINGTSTINSPTWNVYWDNVQVIDGSVTGTQVVQAPLIDSEKTTVSFSITLKTPGDFYEFTVDAKNDGSIDAMIDTITKTINNSTTVPSYLVYEVTYEDGVSVVENHLLAANTKETYRVRVEYKLDISPETLPTTAQSLTIEFGTEYIQKDSNAIPVRTTIYNISGTSFEIGESMPTGVTTYDNYSDAVTAFGHPFFLKHLVSNDIVVSSYVGFIFNNDVYYLKGGGATYNDSIGGYENHSPYYESNKEILDSAFGEENCREYVEGDYKDYYCSDSDFFGFANCYGDVNVQYNSNACEVYGGGGSNCY